MALLRLAGVRVEMPTNVPVMYLTEAEGEARTLPIYIGHVEAKAIVDAIDGTEPSRPLTHDLFRDALVALGATLDRVVIVSLRGGIYFAELRIRKNGESIVVSARPSDGVALAVRMDAEIEIDSALLDSLQADGTLVEFPGDDDLLDEDDVAPEEVVEEFREFLEGLSPDDFGRPDH